MNNQSVGVTRRVALKNVVKAGFAVAALKGVSAKADDLESISDSGLGGELGKRRRDAISIRNEATKLGTQKGKLFIPEPGKDADLRITQFSKTLRRDLKNADTGLAEVEGFGVLRKHLDAAYARTFNRAGFPDAPDSKNLEEIAAYIGSGPEDDVRNPRFHLTNPLGGFSFDLEALIPCFLSSLSRQNLAAIGTPLKWRNFTGWRSSATGTSTTSIRRNH